MRLLSCRKAKYALTFFAIAVAALGLFDQSAHTAEAQGTTTLVWEGRLISDISGLSLGGTIIRVSVIGVEGLPIEVSSAHGGWSTSVLSGSKPELGPYAAEVVGLTAGRYIIAPQGIGATVTVEADGTDIIVVEFVQVPRQAPPPPPPPTPGPRWEVRILAVTPNRDLRGSVLRVSVVGEVGLLVEVSSAHGGWSTTGFTGTKPEYGDYVVEFAPLQRADYIIRPQGVDTELKLFLDARSYVFVEFRRREGYKPPPTPTPTTAPPPAAPAPPAPVTVTATPPAAPSPVPIPVTVWTGEVVSNTSSQQMGGYLSTIQVVVEGMKGLPVDVRAGGWTATAVTGTKPECGDFCLEFGGLAPSLYTITPRGLGASVDVVVEGRGVALIRFTSQLIMPPAPIPATTPARATTTASPTQIITSPTKRPSPTATAVPQMVWAARTLWNTSGPASTGGFHSAIQVSVVGLKGLSVEIRSGGWSATALTSTKPECGEFCLEFGGLSGSTYVITPEGLGINHVVTVDGEGFAVVEFYQAPAQPRPEVWAGRVTENIGGGGTRGYFAAIEVVVEGTKWLPVEIRSGAWSATELTGTKPACGGYCLEFGGLVPGTYVITPQGLGVSVTVTVGEGGFAIVDFYRT
ncbi:MAG: hypothetical protein CEE40_13005 [Chloroflexi bacterium B3_Chlor]|nr:MAG: hypothetical protein CEE40_13005 [Chloroflexi bacterium B3_Chlor]